LETATPTPYAVPAASRVVTMLVTTTRRTWDGADMDLLAFWSDERGRARRLNLDVEETPIPGIWLLCRLLF
jgi:hypothetical protein